MKPIVRSMSLAAFLSLSGVAQAAGPVAVHQDDVLGVSLTHASDLRMVTDQYLLDEEYGFTLVPAGLLKDSDGGEPMTLRVTWLHQESPENLDAVAKRFVGTFPTMDIQQRETRVAGQRALVLENAPGLVPTTYIYVAVEGKLFQVIYPRPLLDARAHALLKTLHFEPARQELASRKLVRARDVLFERDVPTGAAGAFLKTLGEQMARTGSQPSDVIASAVAGCVDYPTWKYLQTPFTSAANGNGYSKAGPSYYGQGLHTGCNNGGSQNDYYALDMPMRTGDPVLNPTNGGTVVWAGWASGGWSTLGRTVIIDQGNGYKSLAAHLSSIQVSSGQAVNADSVIGATGGSGNGTDGYWGSHLHQGLYLNAAVSGGGTYGGQSAQPLNVHYCRSGCANYYSSIGAYQSLSY